MITRSAIKNGEYVAIGNENDRHDSVFLSKPDGFFNPKELVMGFITDEGTFLDREQAAKHAFECGQIKELTDCLISEDLW